MADAKLYVGDAKEALQALEENSVQTCITSPPYWGLRDYGEDGQLGLEHTPQEYVQKIVGVFEEVKRVLRNDGTVWLNLGDSYFGGGRGNYEKQKDLCMIPSRVAMALQEVGWWVRSRIVWAKGNPMPESVTDRPTSSHEYIFLLSQSKQYFYDADAIRENSKRNYIKDGSCVHYHNGEAQQQKDEAAGVSDKAFNGAQSGGATRNKRDVWQVNTKPYSDAHFAVYPPELIEPCVMAGTSERGQCANCGAPWERIVDYEPGDYDYSERGDYVGNGQQASGTRLKPAERKTVDWQPTCDCESGGSEPQTVLDPFSGAGTTGVVALAKGRDYIGIDISREYCEIAADRIRQDAPLMNQVDTQQP